jgi:hypothetical protein
MLEMIEHIESEPLEKQLALPGLEEVNRRTWKVLFKTPVDYWREVFERDPAKLDEGLKLIQEKGFEKEDSDLHIYPFTEARPAMISVGCANRCNFCPTAQEFKGRKHFGNPEKILLAYEGQNVHFMDENFFDNPEMDKVLELTRGLGINFTCMADAGQLNKALKQFGEGRLVESGLKCVEVGLENVALMMKVKQEPVAERFEIYYLNMTGFPGETKETIRANAEWMRTRSLKRPVHYNNGVWYACGQFYHPYGKQENGRMLDGEYCRTKPSFVPQSLLSQTYCIDDIERVNYWCQLIYGFKLYPTQTEGIIGDFIGKDQRRAMWIMQGIRTGNIE